MADDQQPPPASAAPPPPRPSCLGRLLGTLAIVVVSALAGAALALGALWYGPTNAGFQFPDSTGRLENLAQTQATLVNELTDAEATLRGLSDLRGSVDTLQDKVATLEAADLSALQSRVEANLNTMLAIQTRLDELESIPANAALAERLATAELEVATLSATLDRLREALSLPAPPQPTLARPTPTP